MNRVDMAIDDLTVLLSQKDRASAQREYQALATNTSTMVKLLGGPELALYAIRTRIARVWVEGQITTPERKTLMTVIGDWDGSSVIERAAVFTLLEHVGR